MPIMRRCRRVLLLLTICVAVAPGGIAGAQRARWFTPAQREAQAKRFKVGQWVEVQWGREWRAAEVVGIDGDRLRVTWLAGTFKGHESSAYPENVRGMTPQQVAAIKKERAAAGDAVDAGAGKAKAGKARAPGAAPWPDRPALNLPRTAVSLADVPAAKPNPDAPWVFKPPPPGPATKPLPVGKAVEVQSPFPPAGQGGRPFQKPEAIVVPADLFARLVAVAWTDGVGGTDRRAQIVDVVTGNVPVNVPLPTATVLRDVTANGRRLLLQGDGWAGAGREQIHILDVTADGKALKHLVGFVPYPKQAKGITAGKELISFRFLDNDRVLTFGLADGAAKLALWDVAAQPKPKPVYVLDVGAAIGSQPDVQLNPQRTAIAVRWVNGPALLFDAGTGKPLGKLDVPPRGEDRQPNQWDTGIAFDPAGTRAAAFGGKGLCVWDLAAGGGGKLTHDLPLQPGIDARDVRLLDGPFALLDGTDLLDLSKGIIIWEYRTPGSPWGMTAALPGGRVALLADPPAPPPGAAQRRRAAPREGAKAFVTFELPHPPAEQRAAAIKPGSFLAVRPGMTVSLEVSFTSTGGPADIQERAIKRVTEQLRANGINVVGEPQPMRVVIKSVPGESKSDTFARTHGGIVGFGPAVTETVGSASMQAVWHSVAFTVGGQTVWMTSGGASLPESVTVKEGESVQQYVDQMRAASFLFFDNVTLPREVLKPKELLRPGSSTLEVTGIREGPLPPAPEPNKPAQAAP